MPELTENPPSLLKPVLEGSSVAALRFGDRTLTYAELQAHAASLIPRIAGSRRVAVWATPSAETCVAVVAALLAGVPIIPLNPKSGPRELGHILGDAAPDAVLCVGGAPVVEPLAGVPRIDVDLSRDAQATAALAPAPGHTPALVMYTSGTTGPPKGVVLSQGAIDANLAALAEAWQWTGDDVLTHALPLFHVHGLILGVLGPLRLGGSLIHLERFSPGALASVLAADATMMFGVPTMYHRIAEAAATDAAVAQGLRGARLLVSGSAALASTDQDAIARITGRTVIERYGMTETLIICAARADGDRLPGSVGPALPGVEVRLLDDDGSDITDTGDAPEGELAVRSPGLMDGYLNRPEATAEALRDGWLRTGDLARIDADGEVRLVGRMSTDIIKSGGFKIGAGEVEAALLEHPAVEEVAVTGLPDPDLGERVVAWVVGAGSPQDPDVLIDHVAERLTAHKRPREIRFLDSMPRNEMGKVLKRTLREDG